MKKRKVALFIAVVLLIPAMVLMASDPVDIYCLPDLYPLGMGITKVGFGAYQENMTRVIGEIKKAK